MDIRNASVAAALVAVSGSIASAQSIDWLNAVDGDWGDPANWAGGNVPDTTSEIPVLGLAGMYTVTSNANRTFGGLMITNPDAGFAWGTQSYNSAGDILNNGMINLNYNNTVFNCAFNFTADATISGTGTIRLNGNSSTDDSAINSTAFTVTHMSGHTIAGSGQLTGTMINMGDIIADEVGGVGLRLLGSLNQSGGGQVIADGGTVILGNGSITTGGLFSTINGGVINVPSNLAQIGDVNNTGDITINGGGDFLGLISSIENNGNISINDNLNIFNAHLRFDADATINGTGTIDLASPSGDQADAQIIASSPFVGTFGAGQTVQGSGRIDGLSGGIIVNNGTVIANDPDFPLGISGRHNPGSGEYRAEGDGVLGLNNGSILTGVTFDTSGNGSVDVIGNTANVSSITNNGQMGIWGNGYFLTLSGPLTNNGTITINNTLNIFNAHLRFDTNTEINGTGMIVMNVPSGDRADAQIYTVPGITGTIGSDQTVMGSGWIDGRDGGSIMVNGTIIGTSPTDALFIDGIIDASGGGVFRGDNGVLALDAGLVLTGGTFDSVGTGEVNKTGNGTATLSGVTNNGNMGIRGSGGFIDLIGDLTNNGLCTVNSDLNIFNAHLTASSNVTIDGNGTVRLQSAGELADAQMFTTDVVSMTIGTNQTVAGSGQLDGRNGGTIINNGTVNGDDPAFELRMLGNHSGSGVYRSDNGILGLGSGLIMDGGTFDSSGTGMVAKTNNGIATVSNMINAGQINIWGSGGFIDLASDLTNNGEIWLNSNSNIFNAHLRFTDSFEINGTGTIRMTTAGSSGDAQIIISDPATATLGSGQTLIGDGTLVGNINVDGTLDPDGPSRAFVADNLSLSSSSQMIVDLGGPNAGEFDRVVLSGSDVMEIDGTLTINIDSGYAPLFGETWDIISGGTNSGTFSEVITGATPFGQVYRAIYAADRVFVILTCDADLSGDGVIDFFDVSSFLNFFGAQDVRGDLNGDGNFDFFDVSTFLQLFSQGCNP